MIGILFLAILTKNKNDSSLTNSDNSRSNFNKYKKRLTNRKTEMIARSDKIKKSNNFYLKPPSK